MSTTTSFTGTWDPAWFEGGLDTIPNSTATFAKSELETAMFPVQQRAMSLGFQLCGRPIHANSNTSEFKHRAVEDLLREEVKAFAPQKEELKGFQEQKREHIEVLTKRFTNQVQNSRLMSDTGKGHAATTFIIRCLAVCYFRAMRKVVKMFMRKAFDNGQHAWGPIGLEDEMNKIIGCIREIKAGEGYTICYFANPNNGNKKWLSQWSEGYRRTKSAGTWEIAEWAKDVLKQHVIPFTNNGDKFFG